MKVFLAALFYVSLAAPLGAESLSVNYKVDPPIYQNTSMIRSVPDTDRAIVPSLLIGGVIGAGLGDFIRRTAGPNTPFMAYPTIGIGSYGAAPALIFEGQF